MSVQVEKLEKNISLIAEVPRTDTADNHPSVQKPERAMLFPVLCGNGISVLQE